MLYFCSRKSLFIMAKSKTQKIAVIAGGMSDEREVSLVTGNMLYKTLCEGGYTNVKFIDVGFDLSEKQIGRAHV